MIVGAHGILEAQYVGLRIVIIEDDDLEFRSIARVVREHGALVTRATTLAEAHATVGDPSDFDAVLVDIKLPDGSGIDIVKILVARHAAAVALIVMSGFPASELANDLGLEYQVPFLAKPFGLPHLFEALDEELVLARLLAIPGLVGGAAMAEKMALRRMLRTLRETGGNKTKTAARLGVARTTLRDKMKLYDLRSASFAKAHRREARTSRFHAPR